MKIPRFGVEEWLNVWENDARYDIAGSSIASFTLEEIIGIDGTSPNEFYDRIIKKKWTMVGLKGHHSLNKK